MIRNHRNHPSIVFWGAGVNHRGPVPRMQTVAKEEDPNRLTASASSPWNGVANEGITDVHATMDYRRTEFPESAFSMVMEHGSTPNSEVNQFHISRYKARKNTVATITWLGADYNHLQPDVVDDQWKRDLMTTYGVLTPYRIPKPVYYWYKSELVANPIVHIADETASKEGKVRVFSNCQEIELYHNGQLIEKRKPDNDIQRINLEHPSFTFLFNWKEGELKAVGYNNGIKVTDFTRHKQGEPYAIKVKFNINDAPFYTGGSDLRLAHAYIVDKNGEVVTSVTNKKIEFSISGDGNLVDNGKIGVNPAIVYDGVASIYVRPTSKSGEITISAKAKGLKTGNVSILTTPFNTDEIYRNSKPIYNYPTANIDLGGKDQYVQFDWKEWTATSTYKLTNFDAELKVESLYGDLKWHGAGSVMVGDLSFVGADGVYSEKGNLKLTLSNLKKGEYYIETYHHSRKSKGRLANNIEIKINDKEDELIKKADDHIVGYFNKNSSGERKPLHVKSLLKSDGKNPITIEFKNIDKAEIWLNGIVLKQKK